MKCKICNKEGCINHSKEDQNEYEFINNNMKINKLTKSIDKYYSFNKLHYNRIPTIRELASHLIEVYEIETK